MPGWGSSEGVVRVVDQTKPGTRLDDCKAA